METKTSGYGWGIIAVLFLTIYPSAEAERNIFHILPFLPFPVAPPLLQDVVIFVVTYGVIFRVAIVISLVTVTVAAMLLRDRFVGGLGNSSAVASSDLSSNTLPPPTRVT